jgi:outer membrane protein assembly factor BamA
MVAVAWLPILSAPVHGFIPLGEHVTLVPLPEIITDPNAGQTVGVLATFLFADESEHIKRMIAPDVRYNQYTGIYPMFRWFEYLSEKQRFVVQAGKASKVGEFFQGMYSAEDLSDGSFDVRLRAFHENDPFERFYGFGNDTSSNMETNYTSDTGLLLGYLGVNLLADLQVGTQTRWSVVRLRNGPITSVTQLLEDPAFREVPGIDGATIVGQRFAVRYDSRDSTSISTQGGFADAGVEVVDKAFGSSASYIRYGVEGRAFLPLRADKRYILAGQAALDYMQGGNRAPFYDRSPLGGERSLRGFGSNRFIDNNRFFARSELRTNVWEPRWVVEQFKVQGHMELAPFFELGRVFGSSHTFPLEDPHIDGGVAFRAVVPPTLVAYVDVATTGGGATVFTGVDYPF